MTTNNNNISTKEKEAREVLKGILEKYMFNPLNEENFKTPCRTDKGNAIYPEYYAKLHVSKDFLIDFTMDPETEKNIWNHYRLPTVVLNPDMILNNPELVMKEIQEQLADTRRFPR